jgi:type III pantothenate kinase
MLLAIDAGNTNIVFAIFAEGKIVNRWRLSTIYNRTADEYGIVLANLLKMSHIDFSEVTGVIIATVVPDILFDLQQMCRNYFNCQALIVGDPNLKIGIKLKVDRPLIGADIIADAVGAYHKFGGNVIVVDFGTATTFDVIDQEGCLLGGAIAPGVNLAIDALHHAAAQLPKIAVKEPQNVIGASTVPAMQTGIYWGYIGLIEGIVNKIQEELAVPMKTVATGGLAPLFFEGTSKINYLEPDLTVQGLRIIAELNGVT